jgi:hypothetical protein
MMQRSLWLIQVFSSINALEVSVVVVRCALIRYLFLRPNSQKINQKNQDSTILSRHYLALKKRVRKLVAISMLQFLFSKEETSHNF